MAYRTSISLWLTLLLHSFFNVTYAGPSFIPVLPPSYPLAVRNPYLSAWMPGDQAANLPTATPQFWFSQNLTLGILALVDGNIYSLFGVTSKVYGSHAASVVSAEYTATHTIFVLSAGITTFTLDFFSPVSPNNYVRQSLPFSYLTISVRASGTSSPRIQLYCDIDETWTGQAGNTVSNFTSSAGTSIFQLSVNGADTYSENGNDMALWGKVVLASASSSSTITSSQSGSPDAVRNKFAASGSLSNNTPAYAPGDVVGIAQDLGMIATEKSVTFAIGYEREEAINYFGNARTGYYRATYPDTVSAVSFFLSDYTAANNESHYIDSSLKTKAVAAGGSNYSDIILLSTRQAFGALDLTIPNESLNTGDFMIFLKEISSDGNVNTVDVIYPAFPIFYVMYPEYIRLLLEPVVQYLETGKWKEEFVIHDIGKHYPNAIGYDDQTDEKQPVEETGNLLSLIWAYTIASGNKTFYSEHATLLLSYANWLELHTIESDTQLTSDDALPQLGNQTNLAIKASVALNAFGALSGKSNYSSLGRDYAGILYDRGLATDINGTHFKVQYDNETEANSASFVMAYNLFPDVLLKLSTFPSAAYTMASPPFPPGTPPGDMPPLDSLVDWDKTDWMMFTAACSAANDTATATRLINDVHALMTDGQNGVPFSDRFWVKEAPLGLYDAFKARPVVGGHFAILALQGFNLLGLQ